MLIILKTDMTVYDNKNLKRSFSRENPIEQESVQVEEKNKRSRTSSRRYPLQLCFIFQSSYDRLRIELIINEIFQKCKDVLSGFIACGQSDGKSSFCQLTSDLTEIKKQLSQQQNNPEIENIAIGNIEEALDVFNKKLLFEAHV